MSQSNRSKIYSSIITEMFWRYYTPGITQFYFNREEIIEIGKRLG